jgi:hypothetical protein
MAWSDLFSRFFKTILALVGAIVMDYALLDGRMTRQAVAGLERLADDAPSLIDRLITSVHDQPEVS